MRRLLVAMLVIVPLAGAESAAASQTYISCGYPPTNSSTIGFFDGRIHYARHPQHCAWSDNGATYRQVILRGLDWRRWGKRVALARGKIVDSHDMDGNGFQRHSVRIRLSNPKSAVGHRGGARLYYTRMRVILPARGGSSFVENLFRPGQQPVAVP